MCTIRQPSPRRVSARRRHLAATHHVRVRGQWTTVAHRSTCQSSSHARNLLRHAPSLASSLLPARPAPNEASPPLKIALACDWFAPRLGGMEVHLRDLAVRLRARGHDVHVITPTPGDAGEDGLPVHRVSARLFPGFGFAWNPGVLAALRRVLQTERFDVVHAHASIVSPAAYGAAVAALADGTPTLVSFHSVLRNHDWWLGPAVRRLRLPARGARFAAVS